jgi:hypothetical protein
MADAPKSSFELAMERLRAADSSGAKEKPLTSAQKEKIAEARRVAGARLAECEILFRDAMKRTSDPAEREKAEGEYQIDRQRINDDLEQAIDAIRRGRGSS